MNIVNGIGHTWLHLSVTLRGGTIILFSKDYTPVCSHDAKGKILMCVRTNCNGPFKARQLRSFIFRFLYFTIYETLHTHMCKTQFSKDIINQHKFTLSWQHAVMRKENLSRYLFTFSTLIDCTKKFVFFIIILDNKQIEIIARCYFQLLKI